MPYSRLRANLASTMDEVNDTHEPVVVTRAGGKPAVLMSLEDFESLQETCHLVSNPANAARLMEAMREVEAGGGVTLSFEDLESGRLP